MGKTKIEWVKNPDGSDGETWNPVSGCTKISSGCKNCYAESLAIRFWGKRKFTDVQCHHDRLEQPLHWKKPRSVFVNSMSDLFHEDVPTGFIFNVLSVIRDCDTHTFMILTKRPKRMKLVLTTYYNNLERVGFKRGNKPLENLWVGVSVENRKTAGIRVEQLIRTPAAVRFLSCEPLLGFVRMPDKNYFSNPLGKIDWVIVGGESGAKARPMQLEAARQIRDDCTKHNIPFFFKHWGEFNEAGERVGKKKAGNLLDGKQYLEFPKGGN